MPRPTNKIDLLALDAELFEKKRCKWAGTTSLWAYFVSATSSQSDWACKLIKKAKR